MPEAFYVWLPVVGRRRVVLRPDEAPRRTSGAQGRADVLLLLDDALKCSDSRSCNLSFVLPM